MVTNTQEYNRRYYREHKEEAKKYRREYRAGHREEVNRKDRLYYEKHKEKCRKQSREYHRKTYEKLRSQVIELLGSKCVECGFSDVRALQIDHVEGGGTKELERHNRIKYLRNVVKEIQNNSKKYQLLCANCNWIKRVINKEVKQRI